MPQYKLVDITCYCGKEYPNSRVGESVKCVCGVTLHTQQKAHGTGKVWGTMEGDKRSPEYVRLIDLIRTGESKLMATYRQ
jgi:hypothetical protein